MLGDAKLASDFADEMLGKIGGFRDENVDKIYFFSERGIYVIGFSYPVVPKNQARIRVQISGAHTPEDIDRTVDAFIEVGKKLQVI